LWLPVAGVALRALGLLGLGLGRLREPATRELDHPVGVRKGSNWVSYESAHCVRVLEWKSVKKEMVPLSSVKRYDCSTLVNML